MRKNVVLVDLESVQPEAIEQFPEDQFRLLIFVGASQAKVPFELAAAVQRLGSRAEYIKISGNGPNALDFHIAYYIGVIAAGDPSACFHIVSRDTGFDPLVAHLTTRRIFARRVQSLSDIPAVRLPSQKSVQERVEFVVEKLRQPKFTRPRTITALSNVIASCFQKQLSDEEVGQVIDGLIQRGAVGIDGTKLTYASNS